MWFLLAFGSPNRYAKPISLTRKPTCSQALLSPNPHCLLSAKYCVISYILLVKPASHSGRGGSRKTDGEGG